MADKGCAEHKRLFAASPVPLDLNRMLYLRLSEKR